jgi:hypothetical protein
MSRVWNDSPVVAGLGRQIKVNFGSLASKLSEGQVDVEFYSEKQAVAEAEAVPPIGQIAGWRNLKRGRCSGPPQPKITWKSKEEASLGETIEIRGEGLAFPGLTQMQVELMDRSGTKYRFPGLTLSDAWYVSEQRNREATLRLTLPTDLSPYKVTESARKAGEFIVASDSSGSDDRQLQVITRSWGGGVNQVSPPTSLLGAWRDGHVLPPSLITQESVWIVKYVFCGANRECDPFPRLAIMHDNNQLDDSSKMRRVDKAIDDIARAEKISLTNVGAPTLPYLTNYDAVITSMQMLSPAEYEAALMTRTIKLRVKEMSVDAFVLGSSIGKVTHILDEDDTSQVSTFWRLEKTTFKTSGSFTFGSPAILRSGMMLRYLDFNPPLFVWDRKL